MHIFNRRRLTVWLYPLSLLFRLAVALRNFFYDHHLLRRLKLDVPVISIGNLTVGGTGKTPAVEYLARLMLSNELRPAIVTRGYGREARGTTVVSDGKQLCAHVDASGDEAMQLAHRLEQVVIIADESKARGALYASAHFDIEVIIIDDGFQHRQLHRELDIVLLDARSFWENRWMLPAGPFREPLSSLQRADLLLLTNVDKAKTGELSALEALCRKFSSATWLQTTLQPQFFENVATGERLPLSTMRGKRVIAVCGIARPARFFEDLQSLGVQLADKLAYPDHHRFTAEEIIKVGEIATAEKAECLVITEKDATKWATQMNEPSLAVFFLRMEFCPVAEAAGFDRELLSRYRQKVGHLSVNQAIK